MVKLARNEQYIALYPLMTHYFIRPFQAHVIFRPSQGPFVLGLISNIRLLATYYWLFLIVGQIRPVVIVGPWLQSARLWPVNLLGRFHSVIKYDRLTTARYGRPMNGRFQL